MLGAEAWPAAPRRPLLRRRRAGLRRLCGHRQRPLRSHGGPGRGAGRPPIAFGANAPAPSAEQTALATALGDSVSLALANQALRERLRGQALRDALTGLHNRRFLEEVMPQIEAQLARDGQPVAVLMLDLDHFKSINDTHGHAVGDAVLHAVGALLIDQLRRSDVACRYGGEELAVLLPGSDIEQAAERADVLRQAIAGLSGSAARAPGSLPCPRSPSRSASPQPRRRRSG
ncbi:GGDEF domain-containing protein [Paeniroseomonas aquatica]|uniref:GGDEF domain-containing protein n=1 Tax=Paeniroseomonas aquatica TaxID=373043 RepID=UPI0036144F48